MQHWNSQLNIYFLNGGKFCYIKKDDLNYTNLMKNKFQIIYLSISAIKETIFIGYKKSIILIQDDDLHYIVTDYHQFSYYLVFDHIEISNMKNKKKIYFNSREKFPNNALNSIGITNLFGLEQLNISSVAYQEYLYFLNNCMYDAYYILHKKNIIKFGNIVNEKINNMSSIYSRKDIFECTDEICLDSLFSIDLEAHP